MKKAKKIFDILAFIPISLALILVLAKSITDCEFLVGSLNGNIFCAILFTISGVFLLISAVAAILSKTEKNIISNSINRFLRILLICLFIFNTVSDNADSRYYEFTSPDGEHTVVAEEWSYLLSGAVRFYERENPLFISHKDLFVTDDGYLPISSGDYTVEWEENTMTFTAQNGNNNYETIIIEF